MEDKKNNKLFKIIVSCVVTINFVMTIVLLCLVITNNKKSATPNNDTNIKYTLYVGTNDKDTYEPVGTIDICITKVTEICVKYTSGCTISEAKGYWKDDSSAITCESTIVVILEDIEKETVYTICDDIIKELNQNSILVETQGVTSEFYSSSK